MRQLAGQRRPGVRDHARRRDRQQLLAEAAGGKAQREIDEAVDHQQPHRREMPEQRAAEPVAERDALGKLESEQRRGVVDLPSRHDHQDHRHRIDPVHGPDPGRLNDLGGGGYGVRRRWLQGWTCDSLAVPSSETRYPIIRREPRLRYCHTGYQVDARRAIAVTKKRAGLPRLARRASWWGPDQDARGVTTPASARCRPHGSRRSTD